MKIDATKFGLATAIVFAVSWIVCSALVAVLPGGMMQISGYMIHADFGDLTWTMNISGFVAGLIAWGVIGWAIAAVYNHLAASVLPAKVGRPTTTDETGGSALPK